MKPFKQHLIKLAASGEEKSGRGMNGKGIGCEWLAFDPPIIPLPFIPLTLLPVVWLRLCRAVESVPTGFGCGLPRLVSSFGNPRSAMLRAPPSISDPHLQFSC